ncbi:MAG: hypothetical protein AABY97_00535 [Chloroflexota bacterium]
MDDPFQNESPLAGISIGRLIKNLLTGLILLATLCVGTGGVLTFINPQSSFNPKPPPTLPATLGPPTPTNTPAIYLPTEIPPSATPRPLPTAVPTATETLVATETPLATVTPESTPPTTAQPGAQFELQSGSPSYTSDERGCAHMGVGGKVYDTGGAPIVGLAVRIGGQLASAPVGPLDTLTGSAADRFGFGGFYFELSDTPTASDNTLWVQVLDASSGLPLSAQVFLTTFATCDQNLIFVNWKQAGS